MELEIERGTLILDEQDALFRKRLAEELACATTHLTAPLTGGGIAEAHEQTAMEVRPKQMILAPPLVRSF